LTRQGRLRLREGRERPSPGKPVNLDAGQWIEECNVPLRSRAGRARLVCANRAGHKFLAWANPARTSRHFLLTSAPAGDGAVSSIRDGVSDTGAAAPLAQAMRSAEIRRSGPIGTETDEKDNRKIADGRAPSCDSTRERLLTYIVEENGTACEVASGEILRCGAGNPRIFVKFHNDRVLLGDLSEFSFGKAYLNGEWDVEGDTLNALDLRHHLQGQGHFYTKLKFINELFLKSATWVNKRAIAAHYSFGDDFYLTFVDRKYRFYSHGIFHSDDETLEQASEHKLESMYGALQLKPGMRLLDIGAGWGGCTNIAGLAASMLLLSH